MKKIVSVVLAVAMVVSCVSVKTEAAPVLKVSKVLTVEEGKEKALKVSGQGIESMSFLSSDAKVAKVTSKGMVIAMKAGTCIVTVTVKHKKNRKARKVLKKTFSCAVTVRQGSAAAPETSGLDGYMVKEYYIKRRQKNEIELSLELSGRMVAILPTKQIGRGEKNGQEIKVSDLKAGQKIVAAFEMSTLSFPEKIVNCKIVEVLE